MKSLSLRQPWAWAVVHGGKCIENRRWNTSFRGDFLIHAAKGMTRAEYEEAREWCEDVWDIASDIPDRMPTHDAVERGGIVGIATLVDVVRPRPEFVEGGVRRHYPQLRANPDWQWRWHMREQFGFVLENVRPLTFTPYPGALGFFAVPDEVAARALGVDPSDPVAVEHQASLFGVGS